jgi:hypothetical protein
MDKEYVSHYSRISSKPTGDMAEALSAGAKTLVCHTINRLRSFGNAHSIVC